jgi:hypothetical protein
MIHPTYRLELKISSQRVAFNNTAVSAPPKLLTASRQSRFEGFIRELEWEEVQRAYRQLFFFRLPRNLNHHPLLVELAIIIQAPTLHSDGMLCTQDDFGYNMTNRSTVGHLYNNIFQSEQFRKMFFCDKSLSELVICFPVLMSKCFKNIVNLGARCIFSDPLAHASAAGLCL